MTEDRTRILEVHEADMAEVRIALFRRASFLRDYAYDLDGAANMDTRVEEGLKQADRLEALAQTLR